MCFACLCIANWSAFADALSSKQCIVALGVNIWGVTLKDSNGKKSVLVRIGGNPFNDPETRKLRGRNVEVEGYRVGNQVRYVSAREIRRPRPTPYRPKKSVE